MTNEEVIKLVDEKFKGITNDIAKELSNLKVNQYVTRVKLETLLRQEELKNNFKIDEFMDNVDEYTKLQNAIQKLKATPAILDRVSQAMEYNKSAIFPVLADDLDFVGQIAAAGGCLPAVAEAVLILPHSNRTRLYLEKWINKAELAKDIIPIA